MVPPARVRTNRKSFRGALLSFSLASSALMLSSCTPAGPRALLKGEALIREQKFDEAIERLQTATSLLPKNAQAWNHLGLAYHGARQFDSALRAYRTALALDHKLAAARFNLGCLYLEQNSLPAAIEELTSYTLLQPGMPEGWNKLGTAQLRARRLDGAEKCFNTALDLRKHDPEALNGLGIVQYQRRRTQEALNHFNLAVTENPGYAPALLNSAIVYHQTMNNRSRALQKYKQYASLLPHPRDWEPVDALARQLDAELNPPLVRVPPSNFPTQLNPKTNPLPAAPGSFVARPGSNSIAASASPRALAAARTNLSALTNPSRMTAANPPAPPTNQYASLTHPNVEAPRPSKPTLNVEPPVEIAQISEDLVIKPPQDIAPPRATDAPLGANAGPSAPDATAPKETSRQPRKNIFERLNPFANRSRKTNAPVSTAPDLAGAPRILVAENANNIPTVQPSRPAPPPIRRYSYLSPARPSSGNRMEAERHFALGVKAHQAGQLIQARAEYHAALQADPAYYEPAYNQALAGLDAGDLRQALAAYEYALAIKPDSRDARYGFALALKQANYPADAAEELTRLIEKYPDEARAHLSLANLCAQQLDDPALARQHYVKVLEINPRHPDAARIRYWLAANP